MYDVSATRAPEAEAAFEEYIDVFSSLDLERILPFYGAPMMLVMPGGVIPMTDESAVRNTFSLILTQYESGGYGRTEIRNLDSRGLGDGLAEVGGTAVRLSPEGAELNRFLFRYVLRKEGDRWKIVAMVNGDPIAP